MRNQYKQLLDAHSTMIGLANTTVEAIETELDRAVKHEKHLRNELSEARERSPRVAEEAAIAEYEKQLKEVHEDLLATQASEAAAIKERDKLQEQAEETRKIVENYEAKLEELKGDNERLLDGQHDDHRDLVEARNSLAEMGKELSKERKAAQSLQSENKKVYTDLDKARTEIGKLKQEAKRHDQQLAKTVMELQDMRKLKDDLAAQLDASRVAAEDAKTALDYLKAQPRPVTNEKLEEDIHRAGELVQKAIEEEDPEKLYRHLDRAMAKLHRPSPQGAAS